MRLPLAKRLPADARADVAMKRDRALAKARSVAAAIRPCFGAGISVGVPASDDAPAPTGDVGRLLPTMRRLRRATSRRLRVRGPAAGESRAARDARRARATLRAGTTRWAPSFSRSVRRATQRGRPATLFSRVARVAPAAIFERRGGRGGA